MKGFTKWMASAPKWLKIVLALPFLDFVWNVNRLFRSIVKKSTIGIVLGVILLLFGWAFMWVLDIITIALSNKVLWID